ncbi:MAG: FAD-dependent oxidoreductase [Helicobacteraceae bacterium]|nr:FAD-dependent oxidoreductase [Helicobacteraceae bacterium]
MLYDVIVVGSGISGLYAALYAKRAGFHVAVVTKTNPLRSNSSVASGGINAVIDTSSYDSITRHVNDTEDGGDGLSDRDAITQMCSEASSIIQELSEMGVAFDSDVKGKIKQRPFGGTKASRTCYIADKTGASITQNLFKKCREEGIEILSNYQFLNIIEYKEKLSGITVLRRADSHVIALACKALVLAGGGYAGIYRGHTTNPQESCGDVIAAALRAGARISNMEFVQFHPTTLAKSGALISEAARGEGAYIVDERGERFTEELQTRDKLARDISKHILAGHKVYLDFRHLDPALIEERLPSTQKIALSSAGIDITKELLEISPAAHYTMGGIWTRQDTSTDIPYVFACGECAQSGVHGANRLGGNSLLESAYFGRIAGREAAKVALKREFGMIDYAYVEKESRKIDLILSGESHFNINAMRKNLGEGLFKNVGVFRTEESLTTALEYINYLLKKQYGLHCVSKERHNNVELSSILEFKNALIIAETICMCALKRKESRGAHYREDYPNKDDKKFAVESYLTQLQENYFQVSFEAGNRDSWLYKLKKILHLQ